MKNLLIVCIGLLACCYALASNVLIYDPVSTPVPGKARALLLSVHTPLYQGATNAVIITNQVLPNVPLQWMRVSNNVIVAMSAAESNLVLAANASAVTNTLALKQAASKTAAQTAIDAYDLNGRLVRALAEVTLDEINILRASPTNVFAARTLTQLTNALRAKLQAQPNTSP
jgi:hypothetical protein